MEGDKMQKSRDVVKVSEEVNVSQQLEADYINLIHDRVGMLVKFNKNELFKAITSACHLFHLTPESYLYELGKSGDDSPLLAHLVNAITIGETYFFRDRVQIKALTELILPQIINNRYSQNERVLRIWSAGCSSGEEIYTIVMLAKQLMPDFDGWQCHFLATDINVEGLKKGLSGKYSEWAMRSIPEYYLKKYFHHDGKYYHLVDEIRKLVTFEYLNLVNDRYPSIINGTSNIDVIMCRNVLIYFDDEHVKAITERLAKCMADQGVMMLGASDPTADLASKMEVFKGVPSVFSKKSDKKLTISYAEQETSATISPPDAQHTVLAQQEPLQSLSAELTPSLSLNAKAFIYANNGSIENAITLCNDSLKLDKMNKETYYLLGLLLSENMQFKEAESAFRKALYIDQNFLMCRYQLGLFLVRLNRREEGLKALASVLDYVSQCPAESMVPDSQNITYKQLGAMLNSEIELYQIKK